MKYIVIALLLSGCSTTAPVAVKFPDAPKALLEKCPELEKVKDDAKLSDIAKTVALNYNEYYGCSIKTDAWIDWYYTQKKLFEGLK
jgi:hypothetical protein